MVRHPVTSETGASTAILLTTFGVIMLLFASVITLTQVHIAAARAAVASDLAALAASDTARGLMNGEPCTVAQDTVHAHGGNMTGCEVAELGVVLVSVEMTAPVGLKANSRSRAGPKQPTPTPQLRNAAPKQPRPYLTASSCCHTLETAHTKDTPQHKHTWRLPA